MKHKLAIGLGLLACIISLAYAETAFVGTVRENNINVRSDASAASTIICTLVKGESVAVVLEKYDWCKIRLPKNTRVFVKRSFLDPIDEKTAKANADKINIRLEANQSSVILGTLAINEIVEVISEKGDWLKIKPTANTFGWVHKTFLTVEEVPVAKEATPVKTEPEKTVKKKKR
jgi:uncharacterized protein YgiM (DUF1202 family)